METEIAYQREMSLVFFYNVGKEVVIPRSTLYIDEHPSNVSAYTPKSGNLAYTCSCQQNTQAGSTAESSPGMHEVLGSAPNTATNHHAQD